MFTLIENLIYEALTELSDFKIYHNTPSIFHSFSLDNSCKPEVLPAIVFSVEKWVCPQSNTIGTLVIDCYAKSQQQLYAIETQLEQYLTGLFLTDKQGIYCLLWDSTQTGKENVYQKNMMFQIIAYPKQSKDTIFLERKIKKLQPNFFVLHQDTILGKVKPSGKRPIIAIRKTKQSYLGNRRNRAWTEKKFAILVVASCNKEAEIYTDFIFNQLCSDKNADFFVTNVWQNSPEIFYPIGKINVRAYDSILNGQ